jgi:hypothetical protein
VNDLGRLDNITVLGIDLDKMLSANGEHQTGYVTSFVVVVRGRLLDGVHHPVLSDLGAATFASGHSSNGTVRY